jgi:hypothetical protein
MTLLIDVAQDCSRIFDAAARDLGNDLGGRPIRTTGLMSRLMRIDRNEQETPQGSLHRRAYPGRPLEPR